VGAGLCGFALSVGNAPPTVKFPVGIFQVVVLKSLKTVAIAVPTLLGAPFALVAAPPVTVASEPLAPILMSERALLAVREPSFFPATRPTALGPVTLEPSDTL